MIAEIIPEAYDAVGRRVFRPDFRRRGRFRPTAPMGRYLSQPLRFQCWNFDVMRIFLLRCHTVSDKDEFGRDEYFQPPEDFEKLRRGDCDDFALWGWRQVMGMGYAARFVVGEATRYGDGHAWVTFERDGKTFLFDPTLRVIGMKLPQLTTLRFRPEFSVAWNGEILTYHAHAKRSFVPSIGRAISLGVEWLTCWGTFWLKVIGIFPAALIARLIMGLAGLGKRLTRN